MRIIKDTLNQRTITSALRNNKLSCYRRGSAWTRDNDGSFPEKIYFLFKEHIKNKSSISHMDVGAAEGIFISAIIKSFQHDSNVKIIGFEPEQERLEILQENLEYVLGDKDFDIDIYQRIVTSTTTDSYILREFTNNSQPAGSSSTVKWDGDNRDIIEQCYQSITLDSFLDKIDTLDTLKIDVEGGELEVLKGGLRLIEKTKPVIFLELHCGSRFGSLRKTHVETILSDCSVKYKFSLVDQHPDLEYYILYPS